jgi:hypothetical protein
MKLDIQETRILASILCDYATIENCLAPHELDLIIKVAINADFPQDTIEALWRVHSQAVADLET